jgi:hypothetical protein
MTTTPPPPPPPPQQGQGAISVRTKTFPLAFLLLLFKTLVTVDAMTYELPWGEHTFPVPPGTHQVQVCFKYLFGPVGANSLSVEVAPGQTASVLYRSPFIVFMKGKISLV